MGICRGLQVLNVYFGGSLIIDIPADLDTIVKHQMTNYEDCFHDVSLVKGTLLEEISGINHGITNCNHHQGIDVLSDNFVAMAYTNDGLVEAIGYTNNDNKPFLLGVQWHPERMDYSNPLSGPIAVRFLQEANNYANKLKP